MFAWGQYLAVGVEQRKYLMRDVYAAFSLWKEIWGTSTRSIHRTVRENLSESLASILPNVPADNEDVKPAAVWVMMYNPATEMKSSVMVTNSKFSAVKMYWGNINRMTTWQQQLYGWKTYNVLFCIGFSAKKILTHLASWPPDVGIESSN